MGRLSVADGVRSWTAPAVLACAVSQLAQVVTPPCQKQSVAHGRQRVEARRTRRGTGLICFHPGPPPLCRSSVERRIELHDRTTEQPLVALPSPLEYRHSEVSDSSKSMLAAALCTAAL